MEYVSVTGQIKQKRHYTSVWLVYEDGINYQPYFCPGCRNIVIQYRGNVLMEVPGLAPTQTPLIAKCSNRHCDRYYQFLGFVTEE